MRRAHAPSVSRAGAKRVDQLAPRQARGMTRRKAQLVSNRASDHGLRQPPSGARVAFRRAIAAISDPGAALPGTGEACSTPSRAGFRLPPPAPVQPLPAQPRSGPGRLPRTSRVRAREARPQAPHPAPLPKRPREAPLVSGTGKGIREVRNIVNSLPAASDYASCRP